MIALALACRPEVIIADEPTTALDVMIQAQILRLLADLGREFGMSTMIVTHDLGVVAEACDRVLVMYGGSIVEDADVDRLFSDPQHPYTQLLLDAFPDIDQPDRRLRAIPGTPPRLDAMPAGCQFAPRCPSVFDRCLTRTTAGLRARGAAGGLLPGRAWRRRRQRMAEPVLEARELEMHFPGRRRLSDVFRRRPAHAGACRGRHQLQPRTWRGPRAGGRIGLRQDHHRQPRCSACSGRPAATSRLTARPFRSSIRPACVGCGAKSR